MNLFQYINSKLAEIKVDSPEAEAKMVIEHFYNDMLFQDVGEADLSIFEKVFERRMKREPMQYIIGKAFFFNSEFIVNKSVLIPRPETEIMVEKIISALPPNGIMADIGCGSGCIGISVALERPDVQVYSFDISCEALNVARMNSAKLNAENITFIESDLLSNAPENIKFDIVGANLPYVPFDDYAEAQSEVKDHEPQLALTADDGGLEIILRCVDQLAGFMKKSGKVFFEIDPSQDIRLQKYFADSGWINPEIIKDYTDRSRFVVAQKR